MFVIISICAITAGKKGWWQDAGTYSGDFTENSDIDIMVLTILKDNDTSPVSYQLYDLSFDYQMEYGVDIHVIVKNEEQFNYWLGALSFYDNVNREGMVIDG